LLWNIFRHIPEVTAYYEPLNESRWFDLAPEHEQVDPTHRGVSGYLREYQNLQVLGTYFKESWAYKQLYMGPEFWAPDLKKYIDILLESASGRPVLQFNRVDFRLSWLRRHFPNARVVHLYRHPREQWISSFLGEKVPRDINICHFARYDHFYLLAWAKDLRCH